MAPLPDNSTNRLWLDYRGEFGEHTVQFRTSTVTDIFAFMDTVQLAIDGASSLWSPDTLFYQWRFSGAGTNVSSVVRTIGIDGTANVPLTAPNWPRFFSVIGRAPDGRRVRYSFFGGQFILEGDYRLEPGDDARMDAIRGALAGEAAAGRLVSISGVPPLLATYLNVGYNAYWQRQRRKNGP
jgi:hypothetical protein